MSHDNRISVVIPTHGRPGMVQRAARSALKQTLPPSEVIVVLDGPDPASEQALRALQAPNLRVLSIPHTGSAALVRNAGVSAARGDWVAFLDDDDEWLEGKLALQMDAARRSRHPQPVVVTSVYADTPYGVFVWPSRQPRPGEPISEYLLARRSPFVGDGLLHPSTMLGRRSLFIKAPFPRAIRHEDWQWWLEADLRDEIGLEFLPSPTCRYQVRLGGESLTSSTMWRVSFKWIRRVRSRVTPRAYAGFLMSLVCLRAAEQGYRTAMFEIVREAVRHGSPRAIDWLICAGALITPRNIRQGLRAWLAPSRVR